MTSRRGAYRSRVFLLFLSLTSPSEIGGWSNSASAFTRCASDSIVCSFPFIRWGTGKSRGGARGGRPYLAIFQDKTETSGNRLERTKGICSVSHSAKEQFSSGKGGGLPARFLLVYGAGFSVFVGTGFSWCAVATFRCVCVS